MTRERLKNIACLALVASALALTYGIWSHIMGQSGPGLLRRALGIGEESTAVYSGYEELSYAVSAITPLQCAVRPGEGAGLCGTTDRDTASACFERFGALLAEALETAGEREDATAEQWQAALSGTMLFLDFGGSVPTATLAQLLGADAPETLDTDARYVVLSTEDGRAVLYCSDGGGILRAVTDADADYLASLAAEYQGNGYRFAYEEGLAAAGTVLLLTPDTSVAELETHNALETASEADFDRIVDGILENFGFNSYMSGVYSESDGTRVYVEEERTLRVGTDGLILYEDSDGSAEEERDATLSDEERTARIADAARMASQILSSYSGDARLFLLGADYDAESGLFRVSFGTESGGIRILTENAAAAEFLFDGTRLREAAVQLRVYRRTGGNTEIIPASQALAAAENRQGFGLYYYADESGIRAGWYVTA